MFNDRIRRTFSYDVWMKYLRSSFWATERALNEPLSIVNKVIISWCLRSPWHWNIKRRILIQKLLFASQFYGVTYSEYSYHRLVSKIAPTLKYKKKNNDTEVTFCIEMLRSNVTALWWIVVTEYHTGGVFVDTYYQKYVFPVYNEQQLLCMLVAGSYWPIWWT